MGVIGPFAVASVTRHTAPGDPVRPLFRLAIPIAENPMARVEI